MKEYKAHFNRMLDLLQLEQEEEKTQMLQRISKHSVKDRVAQGVSWYPLYINDWYFDKAERLIIEVERTKNTDDAHDFNTGSLVAIFSNKETATDEEQVTGIILSIRGNQAKVAMHCDDFEDWMKTGRLGMNLLYDETSFNEMKRAIKVLTHTENPIHQKFLDIIYGTKTPEFNTGFELKSSPKLNDSQNEALRKALAAQDIAIVHGPPGTGKTTTILQVIEHALATEKQILVTAASNNAVDLLVEKLSAKGIKVLRIGNPARINPHIQEFSLSQQISQHPDFSLIKKMKKQSSEFRNMASKYKRSFGYSEREQRKALYDEAWKLQKDAIQIEEYITSDLIENAQVIAATLVGCTHHSIRDKVYPIAFIDEAGQALEAATWIPILKSHKVIMAGDHQQLPPTVKSFEAAKQGLDKSLFEICMNKLSVDVMLDTQYRMHQNIMGFSNQQFYDNNLIADGLVKNHSIFSQDQALVFVDTAGCGFEEENMRKYSSNSGSLQNYHEADLLFKHLFELHNSIIENKVNWSDLSIGLISPYKAQVNLLKEMVKDFPHNHANFAINTVDGFQGQEKDIIYISLVRSNDDNEIGFLKDYRRMNVALTRARKKLVVIGDSATLGNNKFYADFLEYVEKNGQYASAWEFLYQ